MGCSCANIIRSMTLVRRPQAKTRVSVVMKGALLISIGIIISIVAFVEVIILFHAIKNHEIIKFSKA